MPVGGPDPMGGGGFDAMFNLIMLIVIAGFAYAIGAFIVRTIHRVNQPALSRWARVVGRRQHTAAGGQAGVQHSMAHTWYYLTFECEDGNREEFAVNPRQYALTAEGDMGTLRSQGSWFQGFEREPGPGA